MPIKIPAPAFALFLLACQSQIPPTQPTPPEPPKQTPSAPTISQSEFLSQAQADSLQAFQGKPLPASLAKAIFGEVAPDTSAIHLLSGPLDADSEAEKACWYQNNDGGNIVVLDHRNDRWYLSEPIFLDYRHGDLPPRMDTRFRALVVYSYGWGSDYGSKVEKYYRMVTDSLVPVFVLLKSENSSLNGLCGAHKSIRGTFRIKNRDLIMASYVYKVQESTDDWGKGRTIFQSRIDIPFRWSAESKAYLPEIPKGFPEENPDLSDGEFSFDPYFQSTLYEIRARGPKWKRIALCNLDDN